MTRLRSLYNARFWLTPGMKVKRHVGVAVLGALVIIGGVIGVMLWGLQEERQTLSAPIETVLVSTMWQRWGGWLSLAVLLAGVVLVLFAVRRLNLSLLSHWTPKPTEAAVVIGRKLALGRGPRIVAIGGGTGLSNLLKGLRQHTSNTTAVVTVSDDGGSSGRLRDAFGMPAPGDLSDCLAALSDLDSELGKLLDYRFERGQELEGHTFGNLLITTLTEVEGDFARAISVLNALLNICGAVYPITPEAIALSAIKVSGARVTGESKVREVPGAISGVSIQPERPRLVPEVAAAIASADLIVLGPGSLFTSVIPPLLVPEGRRALLSTRAPLVYICNVMTEAGETDHFSDWDHVEALKRHLGRYPDYVVVNTAPVDAARQARYREEGAEVVQRDREAFARSHIPLIELPLLGPGPHAQHDSALLARWLADFSRQTRAQPTVVPLELSA